MKTNKKVIKENYGESDELNTFIYQLRKRFSSYYEVVLKLGKDVSHKYFAYEDGAKKYYDKLVEEANENKFYYDGATITYNKITISEEEDEIDYVMIDDDEEWESDDFTEEEAEIQKFKQDK